MNPINTFYEGGHESIEDKTDLFRDFVQVMVDSGLDRDEIIGDVRPFSLNTSVAIANGEVP